MQHRYKATVVASCLCLSSPSFAADWSNTEVIFAKGNLENPFTKKRESTNIVTFQHASSWKYGTNFLFIDHTTKDNGNDFYGEWYPFFSSNKILGTEYGGIIKDVGLVLGINAGPDGDNNVLKYLPGLQIDFNFPGFNFFGIALTGYIEQTKNKNLREEDSYMLDIFWQYPFSLGNQHFSFEGHGEYIGARDLELSGEKLEGHALIQPQLRWDLGKTLWEEENLVQLGIEWQHWTHKFGTKETENSLKFLFVWKL